jgi:hypothetical protein
MADEPAEVDPDGPTARQRARDAAVSGRPEVSQAWSLISIAEDLAALRREAEWQRRHGRGASRG